MVDDAPHPDGYARIMLGEDHDPALADARLSAMVRRELTRPEWDDVPADGPLWIAVVCGVCGGDDGGRAECRRCGGSGRSGWKRTGTGDMVSRMLRAGIPVRWVAAPGAEAVDLASFPEPPR